MKKMALAVLFALVPVGSFVETLQPSAMKVAALKKLLNDEYTPYASMYENRE